MPTVLIADDSLFQRMLLAKATAPTGYNVLQADTGRRCLEILASAKPEALVLDMTMPDMNGFEVLEAIRNLGLTTRVVVVTADIQTTTRQRCLDLGASAVLNKPADEATLRACLADLGEGRA